MEQLRLILQNAFDNAAEHTDRGGHVRLSLDAGERSVRFCLRNGAGVLPPDFAARAFERFARGDASHSAPHTRHRGLGLPLCRALVEWLGGTIRADGDAPGEFAVCVELPRA